MDARHSVLVVDAADTGAVLCTALAKRGWRTLCATSSAEALALAERHAPGCIVVDLESADLHHDRVNCEQLARSSERPLVLLGNLRQAARLAATRGAEFVAKPYHYAPLIRKIEALLAARTSNAA
ncbi:MAG: hypothetical protein JSS27_16050 [Planctomycetes bacterium]|nr:hypothetical protein [Planctomycetota bacterium]